MAESKELLLPDLIFESSWEVCNKVGGIYTVLSTRAKTLQDILHDRIVFIGPDFWTEAESLYFEEDKRLMADWRETTELKIRIGRWKTEGAPIAVLVDFKPFFEEKNTFYGWLWEKYGVDSLHAYGDYDEATMFSLAAAKVVESYYKHYDLTAEKKVIYHANEWMTGAGLLYINNVLPAVATVFTTHATSIGRSIAGNNKPLYGQLHAYNGDGMAWELNMESKHSVEKRAAHVAHCFTTVSDITATECTELLDKTPDVVLPNGFDDSFVPKGATFTAKRKAARKRILAVANALTGSAMTDDTLIVATSGRYEFRNKGIDVFIDAMDRLRSTNIGKDILAVIEVPAWVKEPRADLAERIASGKAFDTPLDMPQLTHYLHNTGDDRATGMMRYHGMYNTADDRVKTIFIPCYLDGTDGILGMTYYDLILGNDMCVFPSYYEPWGYTPLESVAFKVPCITTDLAGFGLWANSIVGRYSEISDGAKVIHRTDYNYNEVVEAIRETIAVYSHATKAEVDKARKAAYELSKKALWKRFIAYYLEAYDTALRKVYNK